MELKNAAEIHSFAESLENGGACGMSAMITR